MLRPYLKALAPTAGLAVLVALGLALVSGGRFATAGYPLLLLDILRRNLCWALLGTVIAVAVFEGLRRLLRRLPDRLGAALAVAAAAAPWALLSAYHWNRGHGLRPSQLFEPYAIKLNMVLLLPWLGLVVIAWLALPRWRIGAMRPGLFVAILSVVAGVELAHLALARPPAGGKPKPDILVILVDALRADHLGLAGYPRNTTPNLDALAEDSLVFRQAIAQSTFTKSSIASLFTGRYPYQHGLYWGSHQETPEAITSDLLSLDETTLAEALRERDYLTTAWVQNSHLLDFMGFGQGFVAYHHQQGSVEQITHQFRRFLSSAGRRHSYFSYLHYIDLHDPYRPEPPWDTFFGPVRTDLYGHIDLAEWGQYLESVRRGEVLPSTDDIEQMKLYYDGLIRKVDTHIGRVIDDLKSAGLYDDTLIVITSDHGDGFLEHGFISHSTTPYDEVSRVPLIVKLPGQGAAGRVVDEQVRLIDILPTVLEALGARSPKNIAGCALQPLWQKPTGDPDDPRPLPCRDAITEIAFEGGYPTVSVRTAEAKYIHFDQLNDKLYDLRSDPGEHENLAPPADPEGERLRQIALAVVAQRADGTETIELTEEQIRELKALGYIH